MMIKLNPLGNFQRVLWKESSIKCDVVYSMPGDLCQYYGKCGDNSVCSIDKTPICERLKGFRPKLQHNQTWPKSCVRSYSSDCKSGGRFIALADIKVPELLKVSPNEKYES